MLTVVYRYTKFGLATTAVASSRRITAAQGISPDLVATANWMLGCMLAVVGAVLIVSIAGLTVTGLTLLIVPALAAALLGSFRSFAITMAGGLLIGILQSEVAWLQTYLTQQQGHPIALQGWTESVPFLVIILVLVARGRALPLRSDAAERPPEVGSGHIRIPLAGVVVAGSVLLITFGLSTNLVDAVTTSAALADRAPVGRRRDRLRGPTVARAVRARGRGCVDRREPRRQPGRVVRARGIVRRRGRHPDRHRRRPPVPAHRAA